MSLLGVTSVLGVWPFCDGVNTSSGNIRMKWCVLTVTTPRQPDIPSGSGLW